MACSCSCSRISARCGAGQIRAAIFGAGKLIPAGAFYVNLRGEFKSGGTRDEILGDVEAKKLAYRHNGRFDAERAGQL